MKSEVISVKCSIVRGGTSKGIFILENELPRDPALRDKYVLEIFGSPDVRQIDGLGGADVLTSKLAIVGPSSREDADVDYTFGQVSFVDTKVDYKSNCGNISAGVGPFAIDNGLVKAVEPYTTVRIHQVNTDSIINAKVEVKDGRAVIEGDLHIDGVPTLGSTVELDFSDSVGAITGRLLPTGNITDTITTEDGASYEVSIVDAAIPTVFIKAEALGMEGTETPAQIEGSAPLMTRIEEIRGRCAEKIGLIDDCPLRSAPTPPSSPWCPPAKPITPSMARTWPRRTSTWSAACCSCRRCTRPTRSPAPCVCPPPPGCQAAWWIRFSASGAGRTARLSSAIPPG